VAAVLAAVAGSTAVSVFVSSQADKNRRAYTPLVARGQAWVDLMGYDGVRDAAPTVVAAVTAGAPVREATVVRAVGRGHPDEPSTVFTTVAVPAANACPSSVLEEGDAGRDDWRCQDWGYGTPAGIPVGDARTVEALVGTSTPEAERVLAAGGMVVLDRRFLHDGRASVELHGNDDHEPTTVAFPAALVEAQRPAVAAVLSPAAARRLDLPVNDSAVVFAFDRLPTEDEEEAVSAALEREGIPSEFAVERGFESSYGAGLLALVLAAAAVTLGAAGIATGLAQADARADYATLAAVGAAPSTRRRLAAAQAGVVATLGAALGVAAGLVPGVAFVWALPSFHVVLPWTSLGVTVVVVPLLAALAAALLTRSRLPLRARGAE
jgi:putative ABC transport system permease protein